MAKNYSWGGLISLACGFLFVALVLLCGAFFGPKPVGRNPVPLAEKTSPDGEWSVTVWERSPWAAWAEVHDNTTNRTAKVDLHFDADSYYPKWYFSRIEMDGEQATLGSQARYDEDGKRSDRWITERIVRREVLADKYSGKFEVVSDFPETIQIVDWSDDFGPARRPPNGEIPPGTTYGSRYDWLKQVPDSISVEWYPESDPDNHRQQTISMEDVIPVCQSGRTVFHLDRNGEWSVRFVPAE